MSFTKWEGLFPVLLLTGCASQSVVTGPPSGSVVDSMLSRSASDISAMQFRLHQSGPSANRPVSSTATKPAPQSPIITTALTGKSLMATPPAPLSGAGPANGFIRQSGAAPTLRAALRKIVPPGHTVVFDKAVSADAPELWQWAGNDRWPYVVDKLLATRGMKATVNAKTHTVTVEPAQRAQTARTAGTPLSPPLPANAPIKPVPGGTVKAVPQPVTGRNPFRNDALAKKAAPAALPASASAGRVPAVAVIPAAVVQVRHWRIESGNTVKDWLYSQAAAETCGTPGVKNWTVAWLTPTNYRVDAPLAFTGNFREMLNQLFTLYGTAKVPLYAGVRAAQCVVAVDDKEVH